MKDLEEERARRQQEKIDQLRSLTDGERDEVAQDGVDERQRILERFTEKKPPQRRRG